MGKHYVLNLYGVDFSLLDDLEFLLQLLTDAAIVSEATILDRSYHKFQPQGVTIILLLAESHISIHTVPEKGEAYADVFTCSEIDPVIGCHKIIEELKPKSYKLELIAR